MTLFKFASVLFCIGFVTIASAQSGIGVIPTNADFALHIKTSSATQDPLRLEGLRAGSAETSVLVTDASGKLSYRPAADLFSGGSSLWVNNSGDISPVSNLPVGIGQVNVDNSLILGVTGNQRMSNASQIQFSSNQNYIYAQSGNHMYFVGRQDMSFRNRANSTSLFTVRADNGRVGLLNDNPSVDFEVSGTQRMTGDEQLQFRDGTNYINSPGSNNNWYFHGQQYVVFRDRNDAVDILTVQANTDRVGILNRNPQVDFEVSGTQRMTGTNHLEFGSASNYIYARNNQDLRIHGFTETNFMSRGEAEVVMNIDANTRRVGIGTTDPEAILHVEANNSLTLGGGNGGVARFGDGTYVGVSQNQIGAYNGGSTNPLHLQQFGNSLVIGASNPASSLLDVRGSARVGEMPAVTTDQFVVTANAAGDLRTMTPTNAQALLGDDLGNHRTSQDVIVREEHNIRFNDTEKYIGRLAGDVDIVNLTGGIHVHADDFVVTNESIRPIAHFDGNTRRVGFGEETVPNATIHIDPVAGDFPIRVEDIPIASANITYRRLIISDAGYVYRSRSTVNRNGLTNTKNPPASLRHDVANNTVIGLVSPTAGNISANAELEALRSENMDLRLALQESQQQQREANLALEAKLAALTSQIDTLYKETGIEKEKVKVAHANGKACLHKH